ncbi:MAG: C_GCAxxG_C_C family protein [Candidatus Lokiarchaeota archaeon]|nr:C_GCAxxG_C_C family protein [Candidatus Lokiarchaeota archaeon]
MEQKMEQDIFLKFDEAIQKLEKNLPNEMPSGCAEATMKNILNILGMEETLIDNIMIPLSGGFGGYKSEEGRFGPCGAVVGGCGAVGLILAGKEKMDQSKVLPAYLKSAQFAKEFEKEFGSIVCPNLSGYDFSDPNNIMKYMEEGVWGKKCYKYVLWAIDNIRKLMRKELKKNW